MKLERLAIAKAPSGVAGEMLSQLELLLKALPLWAVAPTAHLFFSAGHLLPCRNHSVPCWLCEASNGDCIEHLAQRIHVREFAAWISEDRMPMVLLAIVAGLLGLSYTHSYEDGTRKYCVFILGV